MPVLKDALQKIVNLSDKQKLVLIYNSYRELLPEFRKFDPDTHGLSLTTSLMGAAAGADGMLHASEIAALMSIFKVSGLDLDIDEARTLLKGTSSFEIRNQMSRFSSLLSSDLRATFITFVAGICSLDDRFTSDEISFIESLM